MSMRLCYVVLSPTFGMYQVAADLTNRFCEDHEVHLLAGRSIPCALNCITARLPVDLGSCVVRTLSRVSCFHHSALGKANRPNAVMIIPEILLTHSNL